MTNYVLTPASRGTFAISGGVVELQINRQFERPASDVTAGGWTTELGASTNLFSSIDEAVPDDADFVQSANLAFGQSDTLEVGLAALPDPHTKDGHKIAYRVRNQGPLSIVHLTVSLMHGSTVIASWVHVGSTGSPATYERFLTRAQAAQITNYANLRLRFTVDTLVPLLTASAGNYALSGSVARVVAARKEVDAFGSYVLTGKASTLTSGARLPFIAAQGAYVASGKPATLTTTGSVVAGVPFWGVPDTRENYIKPNYGTALPASYSYPGDPNIAGVPNSITVAWRDFTTLTAPGPVPNGFSQFAQAGVVGGGKWVVTARNGYTTIPVWPGSGTSGTYNTLNLLITAMYNERDGTLLLPPVSVSDILTFAPTNPPGKHIIVRGAVDANGFPATNLRAISLGGTTVSFGAGSDQNWGLHFDVRNVRFGPHDEDIAVGEMRITTAGSGYTPSTYTNVPMTGGSGTGLRCNITVSAGGNVTAVTVANPGVGYLNGNVCSCSVIGPGTGFQTTINKGEGSTYQWGNALTHANNYGRLSLRNCRIHRIKGNGLRSQGAFLLGWVAALNAEVWVYDSQFSTCSTNQGSDHNIYVDTSFCAFIRIYSHSAITHALKMPIERGLVLNNVLSGEQVFGTASFGNQSLWNVEGTVEFSAYQNVFKPQYTQKSWGVEMVTRNNIFDSCQSHMPATNYFARNVPKGIYINTQDNFLKVPFKIGGFVNGGSVPSLPGNFGSIHYCANILVGVSPFSYPPGQLSIGLSSVGGQFSGRGPDTLNETAPNAYDVQILQDNGQVHSTTATLQAGATPGRATLTLAAGLTATTSQANAVKLKRNANATIGGNQPVWDVPLINEACHNPAHPDYPWIALNDGFGRARPDNKNAMLQIIDRSVFFPIISTMTLNKVWIGCYTRLPMDGIAIANGPARGNCVFPMAPIKATNGEWPDPPNAGSWGQAWSSTWPFVGTRATGGSGVMGSDFVDPIITIISNPMQYDQHLAPANRIDFQHYGVIYDIASAPAMPESEILPDSRWLDSAGNLNKITTKLGSNPIPYTIRQTTLNGNVLADATTIVVTSATGIVAGMQISFAMSGAPWSQWRGGIAQEWFFTTVASVSGNTITLSQAVPYSCSSGDPVSSTTSAGSKPAWWPNVVTWANEHPIQIV